MTNALTTDRLLTAREVCEHLGISYGTLLRYVKLGELRAVRLGSSRRLRFPVPAVAEFLERAQLGPARENS